MLSAKNKEILEDIKKVLISNYPGRIEKIILYGSRSRGDYREYSDYDILVIINGEFDWKFERDVTGKLLDIDLKYDIIVDNKFISTNDLKTIKGRQPYILNAFKEGITA